MATPWVPRRHLLVFAALVLSASGDEAESAPEPPSMPYPGEEPSSPKADSDTKDGKSRKELAEGRSYCEYDNCYELLGVAPDAGPIPIKRAYRRLAAEWHPDKCPGGDYAKCRDVFPKYANAHEILSNSEMRKNYDYVLANPYEFPSFYLKYSRPKYAPKSDLRFVFVLTLLAAAGVQYVLKRSMYDQALNAVKKDPRARYNERLKEIMARQANTPSSPKKASAGARGDAGSTKHNKVSSKPEEVEKRRKAAEDELAAELSAELPLPPSMADNIAVSLFKAPLTLVYTLQWAMAGGMREPSYMTRKALGMSAAEWTGMAADEQEELVEMELWVSEKLEAYEAEVAEAEKSKGKSGKEKRAERLRKKQKNNPSTPVIED